MTHELLANTLGVRREGITEAARRLQASGLIAYRRGRITVIDRRGVEAACCECYSAMRLEYQGLLRKILLGAGLQHNSQLAMRQ